MQWTIGSKVVTEQTVYKKLNALCQDGPTGIVLIGADGAAKSAVISKLWNNIGNIVNIHQYGGAGPDLASGKFVFENLPDLSGVDHEYRLSCVTKFRTDGAKNMAMLWVKYPKEPGWTHGLGYTIDQALRDNPPTQEGIELLIEAEEFGSGAGLQ